MISCSAADRRTESTRSWSMRRPRFTTFIDCDRPTDVESVRRRICLVGFFFLVGAQQKETGIKRSALEGGAGREGRSASEEGEEKYRSGGRREKGGGMGGGREGEGDRVGRERGTRGGKGGGGYERHDIHITVRCKELRYPVEGDSLSMRQCNTCTSFLMRRHSAVDPTSGGGGGSAQPLYGCNDTTRGISISKNTNNHNNDSIDRNSNNGNSSNIIKF